MAGSTPASSLTSNKDIKALVFKAREQGWTVEPTNGGHISWKNPFKEGQVVSSSTPSKTFVIHQIERDLVSHGLILDVQVWRREVKKKRRRAQHHLTYFISADEMLHHMTTGITKSPDPIIDSIKALCHDDLERLRLLINESTSPEDAMLCPVCDHKSDDYYDAITHRKECKGKEGEEQLKRSMIAPPERERIRCPECPDVWVWISQPHKMEEHMLAEHGKKPCPWCGNFYQVGVSHDRGLKRHMASCKSRPADVNLKDAEIVNLPRTKRQSFGGTTPRVKPEPNPEKHPEPAPVVCAHATVIDIDDGMHQCAECDAIIPAFNGASSDPPALDLRDTAPPPDPAPVVVPEPVAVVPEPVPENPKPVAKAVPRRSDATDDELWTLLELVLDGPVEVTRDSMRAINAWLDATRELFRVKGGQ